MSSVLKNKINAFIEESTKTNDKDKQFLWASKNEEKKAAEKIKKFSNLFNEGNFFAKPKKMSKMDEWKQIQGEHTAQWEAKQKKKAKKAGVEYKPKSYKKARTPKQLAYTQRQKDQAKVNAPILAEKLRIKKEVQAKKKADRETTAYKKYAVKKEKAEKKKVEKEQIKKDKAVKKAELAEQKKAMKAKPKPKAQPKIKTQKSKPKILTHTMPDGSEMEGETHLNDFNDPYSIELNKQKVKLDEQKVKLDKQKVHLNEVKVKLDKQHVELKKKLVVATAKVNKSASNIILKYQLVNWLTGYLDKKGKTAAEIKKIVSMTKAKILDYMANNIPDADYDLLEMRKNTDEVPAVATKSTSESIGKKIEKHTGIPILTDAQASELMNKQDYSHIHEGKGPLGKKAGNSIVKLLKHQKDFINGFFIGNLRSAVVYHSVGTGKTFSAVASISLFHQLYPKSNVIILTPPAVMFNFIDAMIDYGINPQDKRFYFMSYDKFSRDNTIEAKMKDSMIIVDEAHNLRTEIIGDLIPETSTKKNPGFYDLKAIKSGKRPATLINFSIHAKKILLLTATPFINTPYDIENLIAIGSSRPAMDKKYFGEMVSGENNRYDYFKFRISKYDRDFKSGDFPEMRERYIAIPAEVDEYGNEDPKVRALAGKDNSFYSGSRQAGLTDAKIKYCLEIIKQNPTKKFVIFTAYVFNGISKIKAMLNEANTNFGFITGGGTIQKTAKFIDGYNNFYKEDYPESDKIRVLLISKAGAEGVNLLETRGIFVIDGVWNEALYEQIVARAVRYRSHKKLPLNEQYVDVYKLFYCYKFEVPIIKQIDEGKGFDYLKFIEIFNELKIEIAKIRKENALVSQPANSIMREGSSKEIIKIMEGNPDFDAAELKKTKKGSAERQAYIKHNLEFGRKKEKYALDSELEALDGNIPSTDFYLFCLQKIKFSIIEKFIKKLIIIPSVEAAVYHTNNDLFNKVINGTLTDEEIIKNLINGLVGHEKEALRILDGTERKGVTALSKLIEKAKDIKASNKAKVKARIKQEFFTPLHMVKKVIEKSGIHKLNKYEEASVLEGSAGWGNIVRGLLLLGAKKKINIQCDMVEIIPENRESLEELQKEVPSAMQLMKEPNFLLYTPSKRYEYIIMNPPFVLNKRFNKEYIRNVHDYDFLKRAYAMLEVNGVLSFITGMTWKENPEIVKFYKDINADITEMKGVDWTGSDVKKGGEVQKLDVSLIYIKKLLYNAELDNKLLEESLDLFKKPEEAFSKEKDDEPEKKEEVDELPDNYDDEFSAVKGSKKECPVGKLNKYLNTRGETKWSEYKKGLPKEDRNFRNLRDKYKTEYFRYLGTFIEDTKKTCTKAEITEGRKINNSLLNSNTGQQFIDLNNQKLPDNFDDFFL